MAKKYIVGNWKMNPQTLSDADKLFKKIKKTAPLYKNVKTILCPPYIYLSEFLLTYSGKRILFGAQDSSSESRGAFTGEISPDQLVDIGADYVILGHSERRSQGETNKIVNKKIKAAIGAGLNVILCVGEEIRDDRGEYLVFLKHEIGESLHGIGKEKLSKIIVAYEPVWAIGGGAHTAMSAHELYQMKLYIHKILNELYGELGMSVTIIYGGSSSPETTEELIQEGKVDGLLVGNQSLLPESFLEIIKITNSIK